MKGGGGWKREDEREGGGRERVKERGGGHDGLLK